MTPRTQETTETQGTRSRLLAVGRRLFAERGFAGTSTEEVVLQAGVTRGALYYHFRNKQDLFRAVFAEVVAGTHDQVASAVATAEADPGEGLVVGCVAFLDACLDPAVQRIALLDAPSVLGWEAWRDAGSQELFGLLAMGLHWAMASGQIDDQPVAPLAHILLGALNEGALFIARADDRATARDQVAAIVTRLVAGLRTTT